MKLFNTEEEAIAWVGRNIALVITPKKKTDYTIKFVYPFRSVDAHVKIVEHLGKQLFKYQQETLTNDTTKIKKMQ